MKTYRSNGLGASLTYAQLVEEYIKNGTVKVEDFFGVDCDECATFIFSTRENLEAHLCQVRSASNKALLGSSRWLIIFHLASNLAMTCHSGACKSKGAWNTSVDAAPCFVRYLGWESGC